MAYQNISAHLDFFSNILDELEGGSNKTLVPASEEAFSLPLFFDEMSNFSKKISHHCTKFCLAFMKPRLPSESDVDGMLEPLKESIRQFHCLVGLLPNTCGAELQNEVNVASVQMVKSVAGLLRLAQERNASEIEAAYYRMTGVAWTECEALQRLPHNNAEAVRRALVRQEAVVADAFLEITESLEGDGSDWNCFSVPVTGGRGSEDEMEVESGAAWTDQDKEKLQHAVNVVKAVKLLYKRCIEAVSTLTSTDITPTTTAQWARLDELRTRLQGLPEAVDDLVLAMYPTVDYDNLRKNAHVVSSQALTATEALLQSCAGTEHTPQHVSFLRTALSHNVQRLDVVVCGL